LRTFKNAVEIYNKLRSNTVGFAALFLSKISTSRFGNYFVIATADCAEMLLASVVSNSVTGCYWRQQQATVWQDATGVSSKQQCDRMLLASVASNSVTGCYWRQQQAAVWQDAIGVNSKQQCNRMLLASSASNSVTGCYWRQQQATVWQDAIGVSNKQQCDRELNPTQTFSGGITSNCVFSLCNCLLPHIQNLSAGEEEKLLQSGTCWNCSQWLFIGMKQRTD